ncbi:MAG: PAS domain-containing protein, partial [Verrucomicrobia bacterium]|nr:PAS domain-containing protein [Verrucomicrobiota bacterium]
ITNVEIKEQEVFDISGHWHLLRIHPYRTADNRIDGAVAVLMDIDEVRSSAQKLQKAGDYAMAIVDTTNQPLLILSHELKIVTANRAFYSTFKVSENDCIGHSLFEISQGQCDIPKLRSILLEIAAKGGGYQDIQIEHDFPHLGHRIMLLNVRQTTDSGRGTQILLAFNDITEHRLAESRNLARLNEVSAANEAKDRFLATLSHELRTPLTPVLLSVSTLSQREDLPKDLHDELQMIRRNIELEARLIDDLLDLTAATQGKLAFDFEIISAKEILMQAVQIVRQPARTKNIGLSITESAELFNIKGDSMRLKQVLWNLLSNAIKFTEPGGKVRIHLTNIPKHKLRIEIQDTGIGIAPDMLPFIFNVFEQGSPKITQRFGGLGLGLAIVKTITESHGGTVSAESLGENQGTR